LCNLESQYFPSHNSRKFQILDLHFEDTVAIRSIISYRKIFNFVVNLSKKIFFFSLIAYDEKNYISIGYELVLSCELKSSKFFFKIYIQNMLQENRAFT
jgi:hypothetical protein